MKAFTFIDALALLCKSTNKYGMFISMHFNTEEEMEEIFQAAPYIENIDINIIADGYGFLLFDTEQEMEEYYTKTVGDKGPTKLNKYNGKCRVFALTCGNNGKIRNANS